MKISLVYLKYSVKYHMYPVDQIWIEIIYVELCLHVSCQKMIFMVILLDGLKKKFLKGALSFLFLFLAPDSSKPTL